MDELTERLAEALAVCDAATEGPWIAHDLSDGTVNSENDAGWWWVWQKSRLPYYGGIICMDDGGEPHGAIGDVKITDNRDGHQERSDAVFIAHAREALPRANAALLAVLELHKPVGERWIHGPVCTTCTGSHYGHHTWPCATVTAIQQHLEADDDDQS